MTAFLPYFFTGVIGAIVAISEIVSRYRDDPLDATTSRAGVAYILINVGVSACVLFLIRDVFAALGTPDPGAEFQQTVTYILVAGASAMAILRTSLMTVHVYGNDIQVGLAAIIDVFRVAVDRDVDRLRAGPRAKNVAKTMDNVSFERARTTLTSAALSSMQNVSADERAQIEQRIAAIAQQADRSDSSKAIELGLILGSVVGFENLETLVSLHRDSLMTANMRSEVVEQALSRLEPEVILKELPVTCLSFSPQSDAEQQELRDQIDALIASQDLSEKVKAINTALILAHFVGTQSFESAVDLLVAARG